MLRPDISSPLFVSGARSFYSSPLYASLSPTPQPLHFRLSMFRHPFLTPFPSLFIPLPLLQSTLRIILVLPSTLFVVDYPLSFPLLLVLPSTLFVVDYPLSFSLLLVLVLHHHHQVISTPPPPLSFNPSSSSSSLVSSPLFLLAIATISRWPSA